MTAITEEFKNSFTNAVEHSRFKYAEEDAHGLDRAGKEWVMFRDADRVVIEEGVDPDGVAWRDEYTHPNYVVLWNG